MIVILVEEEHSCVYTVLSICIQSSISDERETVIVSESRLGRKLEIHIYCGPTLIARNVHI